MPALRAALLVLPCLPGRLQASRHWRCLLGSEGASESPACSRPARGPVPPLHLPSSVACLEGLSWAPPCSLFSSLHLRSPHVK